MPFFTPIHRYCNTCAMMTGHAFNGRSRHSGAIVNSSDMAKVR